MRRSGIDSIVVATDFRAKFHAANMSFVSGGSLILNAYIVCPSGIVLLLWVGVSWYHFESLRCCLYVKRRWLCAALSVAVVLNTPTYWSVTCVILELTPLLQLYPGLRPPASALHLSLVLRCHSAECHLSTCLSVNAVCTVMRSDTERAEVVTHHKFTPTFGDGL